MTVQKALHYGILAFVLLAVLPSAGLADHQDAPVLEDEGGILEVSTGYRWVNTDDNPNRASEYSYLENSATFGLVYKQHFGDRHFSLVGEFINENDFSVETDFAYKSIFRLSTRSERLYHNLGHIPYQDNPEARDDAPNVSYTDNDPATDYGRRITINEVKMRGKLPTYPAHINFAYWRMEKKSKEQLRFTDENCAGACHMQSRTRKTDRVTEEIKAGIDAHLGPVDVAFLQTLREFREKEDAPVSDFGPAAAGPNTLRQAGYYPHDDAPDSSLTESTFLINLPPSGGFVSSASYTFGTRENDSDQRSVNRVGSDSDYQKLAADATYTPGENWTVNFRYRMLDLDNDSPSIQTSDGVSLAFGGQIPVRESVDIDRSNYTAFVSYRPSNRLTFKGEFEHEDLERNNTGVGQHITFAGVSNPNWDLSDREKTNRLRLTFFSRLLEKSALKLSGWYEHRDVSDPAYSTTLSDSDEWFFSTSYRPSPIWGITGNLDILRGDNDDRTVIQFDGNTEVPYDLDRNEEREKLSLGLWFVPNDIFSADLNYGLLHSRVEQDLLFGDDPDTSDPGGLTDYTIQDNNADYEQKVHTLSLGLNLRVREDVNCRLEGYHIRSTSEFSPDFAPTSLSYGIVDSDELSDISEVDIQQNGIKARIRWQLTEMLTAGLEYSFDDYEDHNSSVFDGTVQTFTTSLSGVF